MQIFNLITYDAWPCLSLICVLDRRVEQYLQEILKAF